MCAQDGYLLTFHVLQFHALQVLKVRYFHFRHFQRPTVWMLCVATILTADKSFLYAHTLHKQIKLHCNAVVTFWNCYLTAEQTKMSAILLPVLMTIGALIHCSSAKQCYQCISLDGSGGCNDPFNADGALVSKVSCSGSCVKGNGVYKGKIRELQNNHSCTTQSPSCSLRTCKAEECNTAQVLKYDERPEILMCVAYTCRCLNTINVSSKTIAIHCWKGMSELRRGTFSVFTYRFPLFWLKNTAAFWQTFYRVREWHGQSSAEYQEVSNANMSAWTAGRRI